MVPSARSNIPRTNFLVCEPPPHVSSQTPITRQQLSAMLAPTLRSNPVSFAQYISAAPHPVSDLKPVGFINQSGVLFGLCLESPSGEVTYVIVNSAGFPGNILYRGSYRGINEAMEAAALMGYPSTLCWVTKPATSVDARFPNMPPGYRKVDLKIRYIDAHPREDKRIAQLEYQDDWMMIVFPHDRPSVIGHVRPGFDPAKQSSLIFKEVLRDSLLGMVQRVGQLW
jgi:hypothetical protein